MTELMKLETETGATVHALVGEARCSQGPSTSWPSVQKPHAGKNCATPVGMTDLSKSGRQARESCVIYCGIQVRMGGVSSATVRVRVPEMRAED